MNETLRYTAAVSDEDSDSEVEGENQNADLDTKKQPPSANQVLPDLSSDSDDEFDESKREANRE